MRSRVPAAAAAALCLGTLLCASAPAAAVETTNLFLPTRDAEQARAIQKQLEAVFEKLPFIDWAMEVSEQPPGLSLGNCGGEMRAGAERAARALAPRLETRTRKDVVSHCPELQSNYDGAEWAWPQVKKVRVGRDTLSVVVFHLSGKPPGEPTRVHHESAVLALLHDAGGVIVDYKVERSEDQDSALTAVKAVGKQLVVVEQSVPACVQRTITVQAQARKVVTSVRKKPLPPGRCAKPPAPAEAAKK